MPHRYCTIPYYSALCSRIQSTLSLLEILFIVLIVNAYSFRLPWEVVRSTGIAPALALCLLVCDLFLTLIPSICSVPCFFSPCLVSSRLASPPAYQSLGPRSCSMASELPTDLPAHSPARVARPVVLERSVHGRDAFQEP
jgi:hypothetical protein